MKVYPLAVGLRAMELIAQGKTQVDQLTGLASDTETLPIPGTHHIIFYNKVYGEFEIVDATAAYQQFLFPQPDFCPMDAGL